MIELRAAHSYERTPPSLFGLRSDTPDLLRWFLSHVVERSAECPPEGCFSLDGCLLLHGQYAFRDGNWLPETAVDFTDHAESRLAILNGDFNGWLTERNHDDGVHTAAIFKRGSANYGHFLTDVAPKIANIARAGHRKVRFLVPVEGKWASSILEVIASAFDIEAIIEPCRPSELATVRGVHFYSPVARHNEGHRKSYALLEMRARLCDAHGFKGEPGRRIFVARSSQFWRGLINAREVESIFARLGFEIVRPEKMSFAEQIRLFSAATHIAGPLGAGMANIIFSQPGTEILMLDCGLGDRYFWDLTCLGGQRFHWLFTHPLAHYSTELAESPFHVDPQALHSALRACGWDKLPNRKSANRLAWPKSIWQLPSPWSAAQASKR